MKPKKSLGQNFFVNENLGNKIVEYIKAEAPEIIVEIGSGTGFFTRKLSNITSSLVLIEKDDSFASNLQLEFADALVINTDFLDWDFKALEKFKNKRIVFFGSLPYNVSKPIIQKIISSEYFNKSAYFIIQKEVADKYTALDSNILKLKTQLYSTAKKLFDINPGSFIPRPKVTSSYILFSPGKDKYNIDKEKLTRFLEGSFRSPRKTLRNNLKGLSTESISEEILNKRPADISLAQYLEIFTKLH